MKILQIRLTLFKFAPPSKKKEDKHHYFGLLPNETCPIAILPNPPYSLPVGM